MGNINLLSAALSLLASAVLWLVWQTDRKQKFSRDIARWFFFSSWLFPAYILWRGAGHDSAWYVPLSIFLIVYYALSLTFMVMGVYRFATEDALRAQRAFTLFVGLVVVFTLMFQTQNILRNATAIASLLMIGSGLYAARSVWHRGRSERVVGLLFVPLGLTPFAIAVMGESGLEFGAAIASFFRSALAYSFVHTALRRSASEATRLLERFEVLSENSLQGLLVQDTERYYYVNPAVVAMYGYSSAQEMMRDGPYARGTAEDREYIRSLVAKSMVGGHKMTEDAGLRTLPDGSQRYLRFFGWPVDWDGHPAMQVLVADETQARAAALELQRVEQEHKDALVALNAELEHKVVERTRALREAQAELVQREKMASLGRMVAGISHELNTPIGTALTAGSTLRERVQQLQRDVDTGQIRKSTLNEFLSASAEGAALLESNLHKAHSLITNFRKATQNHTEELRIQFSLSTLFEAVAESLRPAFDGSNISIEFAIGKGIDLESYPGQIEQILIQLIDNARGHAFNGHGEGGSIVVSLTTEGASAVFAVSDNGKGIEKALQGKIFDPFFTTRLGGSTGLGLNTVYTLVTRHLGGTIRYLEAAPHGSRFEVTLPLTVEVGTDGA